MFVEYNILYAIDIPTICTSAYVYLCFVVLSFDSQAAIWHCLNNYAFQDATFLAERLCSESE